MGNNLDLIKMFGLPEKVRCPRCKNYHKSWFDDYDIECGEPNPEKGIWNLNCQCEICGLEYDYSFKVKIEEV